MITVDFLISFGYCKKHYFETRKEYLDRNTLGRDEINRITDYRVALGEDRNQVNAELIEGNRLVEPIATAHARAVIQIMADGANALGWSEDKAREHYRSG